MQTDISAIEKLLYRTQDYRYNVVSGKKNRIKHQIEDF